MVCRLLKELLDDGKPAAEVDDDEVTWETVQEVFDRVQDRSWQLLADDLTVCIRSDGSDWILGAGGFGRVCTCPLSALERMPSIELCQFPAGVLFIASSSLSALEKATGQLDMTVDTAMRPCPQLQQTGQQS